MLQLINNRKVFLTVLEVVSPRLGCQHGLVLVRPLFQVSDCWFFLVSLQCGEWRGEASCLVTLVRALISLKGSTFITSSSPNDLQKAPPPNITRIPMFGFWKDTNIQFITVIVPVGKYSYSLVLCLEFLFCSWHWYKRFSCSQTTWPHDKLSGS